MHKKIYEIILPKIHSQKKLGTKKIPRDNIAQNSSPKKIEHKTHLRKEIVHKKIPRNNIAQNSSAKKK